MKKEHGKEGLDALKLRLEKETNSKRRAELKARIAYEAQLQLEIENFAELLLDIGESWQQEKRTGNLPR